MINDTKYFFYNYLHLIIGNVGYSIVSIISVFLLVKLLSPEGYGIYVLFMSVASIISVLTMWSSSSIVRYGREEFTSDSSIKKTFWANYTLLIPAFVICFILVYIFRGKLSGYIGVSESTCVLLFVYILVSNLATNIPVSFQAMGKMKLFAYLPLITGVSFMIFLSVMYLWHISAPVDLLIYAAISVYSLAAIVGLALLWKHITPIRFSWDWAKKCFSFSWPYIFGGIGQSVSQSFGQVAIGLFMAASFAGIYNIAFILQNYLIMIPMLSIGLMFPLMTSLVVSGDRNKIEQYVKTYVPQIEFLWVVLVSTVILLAREIFSIFGVDYMVGVMPFTILLVGVAFRIIVIIESPIIVSYGLNKQAAAVSLIMGMMILGLYYLLIPRLGINGAAIANASAFIFGAIAYSFISLRWLGLKGYKNFVWFLPVIVSFVGCAMVESLIWRLVYLVVVVAVSLLVAKKALVFNMESKSVWETVSMPMQMRRAVNGLYKVMS